MQNDRLMFGRLPRRGAVAAVTLLLLGCGWSACAAAATCSVSSPGVAFGGYDPLASAPTDGVGNIAVSCDGVASYTIALGPGGGDFTSRAMTNGSSALQYNLYTSPLRTTVWGDGSGNTSTVSDTATGGNYAVYGRINERQNVTAGTYSDTLTITITY